MVQINFAQKEIQCKIVYYGPGMSGKTTNLELVHGKVPDDARGELTSIATTGERTLYFDYMPLDLGQIAGIRTKFQLYTVPGQIYYKSTRRLVLQGVDGIVFVADSSAAKLKENHESLGDLQENLSEMGKNLADVPIVIQYNKRDLPDAMSIEELEREINPSGLPYFEAVATTGDGVFPTLKSLAGLVLETVNKGGLSGAKPRAAPAAAQAPAAAAVPAAISGAAVPATQHAPVIAAAQAAPAAVGSPAQAEVPVSPLPPQPVAPQPPPPPVDHGAPPRAAPPPAARPSAAAPPILDDGAPLPPTPARQTAPVSVADRDFADRVVKVHGLSGGGGSSRLPVILALFALIAGAVIFAVSKFL